MRRTAILLMFLLLLSGATPIRAERPERPDLGRGDLETRLATAAEVRGRDVPSLVRALLDLGSGEAVDGDLEFLAAYASGERSRALRLVAISSAERLDREGAFREFEKIATAARDERRAALATEALGYLAADDRVENVAAFLDHESGVVAVAAADALARFAPANDLEEVLRPGLANADEHVLAHVAWACLDIARSASRVEKAAERVAKKEPGLAPRVEVIRRALEEGPPGPWRYGNALSEVRRLASGSPPGLTVRGYNPDQQGWMDDWLVQVRADRPATLWLLASVFDRVNATNSAGYSKFDLKKRVADLGYEDASLVADRLTILLARRAVLGLRMALKEPYDDHRGWEAAFFDTYDLCVAAGVDGAGSAGGATLEHYLNKTLARRPWEWEDD